MKKYLLAALLTLAMPTMAFAKSFTLGGDHPVATITVPDDWDPTDEDNGVSATSPDGTYFLAEGTTMDGLTDTIKEDIKYLAEQGVKISDANMKTGDMTVGGFPATVRAWKGTDNDGEALVTLVVVIINDKNVAVLLTWASPEASKADDAKLDSIAATFKAVQ